MKNRNLLIYLLGAVALLILSAICVLTVVHLTEESYNKLIEYYVSYSSSHIENNLRGKGADFQYGVSYASILSTDGPQEIYNKVRSSCDSSLDFFILNQNGAFNGNESSPAAIESSLWESLSFQDRNIITWTEGDGQVQVAFTYPVRQNPENLIAVQMTLEQFSKIVFDALPFESTYQAIYGNQGELLAESPDREQDSISVKQGADSFDPSSNVTVTHKKAHGHYNIFIPLQQPEGWFIGAHISSVKSVPKYTDIATVVFIIILYVVMIILLVKVNSSKGETNPFFMRGSKDPLTGLGNVPDLEHSMGLFFRRHPMKDYSLICMDIVAFRRFNTMFGHEAGDKMLEVMGKCIRENYDCGTRINGDLFLFLSPNSVTMAQDIKATVSHHLKSGLGDQYQKMVNVKMGIYPLLEENLIFRDAYDGALLALKEAKHSRDHNEIVYDRRMRSVAKMNKDIEINMFQALVKREFVLYIQPKFHAMDNSCCGGEALIRWNSEQMGFLTPNHFIPLFEQNSFIAELDFYMLDSVLAFLQSQMEEGKELQQISVNQSRITISFSNYLARVQELVDRYDVPLHYIEIEITESAMTEDYDTVVSLVARLHEMGFPIAMDDFGTGFSSLNTLRLLPVDTLKIDKGFLRETDTSQRGRKIIENIINMSKDLGIETVCEGVETGMQLDFLKNAGCDIIQGFLLAKPMPVEEYTRRYIG